jgi:rubrerythrin
MTASVWARLREWIKPQTNANAGLNWDLEEAADRGEELEREKAEWEDIERVHYEENVRLSKRIEELERALRDALYVAGGHMTMAQYDELRAVLEKGKQRSVGLVCGSCGRGLSLGETVSCGPDELCPHCGGRARPERAGTFS